ncbi:MAG: hypothetical protein ACR2IS_18160 [Nitrososphaeraceae archaeon]
MEAATGTDDVPGIGIYLGIVLESRNLFFNKWEWEWKWGRPYKI